MARITVEDCLKKVESRFELVLLAAGRAKMLLRGGKSVVEADNREIVTALREIAEGRVYFTDEAAAEPEIQEAETEPSKSTEEGSDGKESDKKETKPPEDGSPKEE
jgi:DNA-directed RNA polymerase subunit omega